MMKLHLLPLILTLLSVTANAQTGSSVPDKNDPQAQPAAVVICGNARFTVLTPRLIRMEWAADGVFEDRATLAVVNRNLDVPKFRTIRTKNGVTINTSALTLQYKGPGRFSEKNLNVSFSMKDAHAKKGVRKVRWTPGADDSANLMGTYRTLDRCDGLNPNDPFFFID